MRKINELINIPITGINISLYTTNQLVESIADKYQRVVIGQRGPYIEFTKNQIKDTQLYIPRNQLYRLSDPKVYYIEFRTTIGEVKVYYQMRSVAYADYLINHFYISPYDLYKENGESCMLSPTDLTKHSEEFFDFAVK